MNLHLLTMFVCSVATAHVKIQYRKGFFPGQFRFLIDRHNGSIRARRIHEPITLQNGTPSPTWQPKAQQAIQPIEQQAVQPVEQPAEQPVEQPAEQPQTPETPQQPQEQQQKMNPVVHTDHSFRFNIRWQEKCPTFPHPPRIPPNIPTILANAHSIFQANACGLGGKATYYTEWNSNPGSCGYIPQHDNLVAVAPQLMPNACGRCILIRYNGRMVKAVVTDTCMACAANTKWIDMSHHLFGRFDNLARGVLQVDWDFVQC